MVVGGGLGAGRESRGATLGVHIVVAQCERKWEDQNEERRKLFFFFFLGENFSKSFF